MNWLLGYMLTTGRARRSAPRKDCAPSHKLRELQCATCSRRSQDSSAAGKLSFPNSSLLDQMSRRALSSKYSSNYSIQAKYSDPFRGYTAPRHTNVARTDSSLYPPDKDRIHQRVPDSVPVR